MGPGHPSAGYEKGGLPATFSSDGTTASIYFAPADLETNLARLGILAMPGTSSDLTLKITIATGSVETTSYTADLQTNSLPGGVSLLRYSATSDTVAGFHPALLAGRIFNFFCDSGVDPNCTIVPGASYDPNSGTLRAVGKSVLPSLLVPAPDPNDPSVSMKLYANHDLRLREMFADADQDTVADPEDNCVDVVNAAQADVGELNATPPAAADGVGDACDVCPDVYDPNQVDTDADGEGDLCEPTQVQSLQAAGGSPLTGGGPILMAAAAADPNAAAFDVFVACGANEINQVALGLILASEIDPNDITFGGGSCTAAGCTLDPNSPDLGSTVDAGESYTRGPDSVLAGLRSDTFYFKARGNVGPNDLLCVAGDTALIGRIEISGLPAGVSPAFTTEGVEDLEPGLTPLADPGGDVPLAEVRLLTGSDNPTITLELGPGLNDPNGTSWELLLTSDARIHRMVVGLVGFDGVTPADVSFGGLHDGGGRSEPRQARLRRVDTARHQRERDGEPHLRPGSQLFAARAPRHALHRGRGESSVQLVPAIAEHAGPDDTARRHQAGGFFAAAARPHLPGRRRAARCDDADRALVRRGDLGRLSRDRARLPATGRLRQRRQAGRLR